PDPVPRLHRRLRHAGGGFRPLPRAVPVDSGPVEAGRPLASAVLPAVLRLLPEPAAVPDERDFCGGAAAVSLRGPHALPGSQASEKPARHDPALLRPLLPVPRRHGAVLDVDERRPARQPGARAVVAVPASVGRLTIAYCYW